MGVGVSMLSKIVSLSLVALAAGQVQIEGSPEWQAYKNAELAHIAPSTGPSVPGVVGNWAQSQLNWLAAQQAIVAAGAGRKKRQVQVVGSPEWQAYKNTELAHIAPSIGPVAPVNYAQAELNHVSPSVGPTPVNHAQALLDWQAAQLAHQAQAAAAVAGHGRRKRQVQVVGSPEWQAYKNAELAHIAPSTGPNVPGVVGNWAQSQLNWLAAQQAIVAAGAGRRKRQAADWQENFVRPSQSWEAAFVAGHGRRKRQTQAALDFVAPAPGPPPVNYAQSALDFVGPAPGPTPVNYAQSALDFVGPAPGPTPGNFAQAQLNFQQEALNFIARG